MSHADNQHGRKPTRAVAIILVLLSLGVAMGACDSESSSTDSTSSAESESTAVRPESQTAAPADSEVAPAEDGTVAPNEPPDDGANPLGGDSPEDQLMPNVMCMNLQDAQNEIQDHGVFFSGSVDATGQGRRQIIDSNWVVVGQSPDAGSPIGEGDAELSVVKHEETNEC